MRVLFVNPPCLLPVETLLLHPPLGFGYLANALKKDMHEVLVADLPILENSLEYLFTILKDFRPDVIGITCVAQTYLPALQVATIAKQWCHNLHVVIGGPHVTFIPEEALARHSQLDYIVLFDAEDSFTQLISALSSNAGSALLNLKTIPGLAYRDGNNIHVNPPLPPVKNLDVYSTPDRSIFDINWYLKHDYETVVMTARGCPGKCKFCSTRQNGRDYRWHGVDHVCNEIEHVLGLGFSSIFFGDDTFSGNKKRLFELCDAIKRRRLGFEWTCNIRVADANPDVLDAMMEAGAYRVFVGFESTQQPSLDLLKKGTTLYSQYQAAQNIKSSGLQLHGSFIIGAPGDTYETISATLDFIRLINPTIATFNAIEVRPGTEIYHNPEKYDLYIPDPYWYEKDTWINLPTCFTKTLSQKDIKELVETCYLKFCTEGFIT